MLAINNKAIGNEHPAYIIAEIGINHNGRLDLALRMVEEAARSGVDAVKVQIISADKSYTKDSPSHAIFKAVELPMKAWKQVVARAYDLHIDIFATVTQPKDMATVKELELPVIKISSSNITNFPLLKAAAKTGKPILLSTGMAYLSEVDEAVRYCEGHGCTNMGILHCTSSYPVQMTDVNLRAIETLRLAFPYPVGFSDHTIGNHCAVAAVVLGTRIIEKHFTLNRSLEGPDHHFSATPDELIGLVKAVRDVENALGSGIKRPTTMENTERLKLQRVLVAAEDIAQGAVFTEENMAAKRSMRPGLAPRWYAMTLGRRNRSVLTKDEPITLENI